MFGRSKQNVWDAADWKSNEDAGIQEDNVHTPAHPYCSDMACWCHTDVGYHDQVISRGGEPTEREVEEAFSFFGLFRRSG